MTRKSIVHVKQILAWADEHFERKGQWPEQDSGRIAGMLDEKWINIDQALRKGLRGLREGSSLARLLAEHRGKRNRKAAPPLTLKRILGWADAHYARQGKWPHRVSGPIVDAPGETWNAVDLALGRGQRGLPGGSSLPKLLAQRRGVRNRAAPKPLSRERILAWADAYHARTGMWPSFATGPIAEAADDTWNAVDKALRVGRRGLRGGSSLARLLQRHRGVYPGHRRQAPLAIASILAWADAHRRRHGRWPKHNSGAIAHSPGDTWWKVNTALREGQRGLGGGSSLARLLAEHRGVRYHLGLPPFTTEKILAWADAYHRKHGYWPTRKAGPVDGARGVTWSGIIVALSHGQRGLPGGSSLPRLLEEHRGVPNRVGGSPLSIPQILAWADALHDRTGVWPYGGSGAIVEAPGETWRKVERALQRGARGLPFRSSLAKLLHRHRGVAKHRHGSPLSVKIILRWADAHRKQTGGWPKIRSGAIPGTAGITWESVANALRDGRRGLTKGLSIARLLYEHRGVRNSRYLPSLTEKQIIAWAEAHYRRHGKWPAAHAGTVEAATAEKWINIDYALRRGARGLRGGSSLFRLLARHRRRRKAT
ncbi:MAG TPA: hypothetical protein VGX78_10495 [Pirellulales bacterium]|nr:hypothetical protein [Pirellulales bacterium]